MKEFTEEEKTEMFMKNLRRAHGQRQRACKCGGAMKKVTCFTKECKVYECRVCGRRGHYGTKPANCVAGYG